MKDQASEARRNGRSRCCNKYDYVIVGGGLHGSLAALSILHNSPHARIALIEKEAALGGSHTWSFFPHHIHPESAPWFADLIYKSWPGHQVLFPGFHRKLSCGYASITSESLHRVVMEMVEGSVNGEIFLGDPAVRLTSDRVVLKSGAVLRGRLVLDGRGQPENEVFKGAGVQKFYGVEAEVELVDKTRLGFDPTQPCLMDATVKGWDGYRFFYILPFAAERWLVEETFFSDEADFDNGESRKRIERYLHKRGVRLKDVLREESGALAMPWRNPAPCNDARLTGDYAEAGASYPSPYPSPFKLGLRGGWYHPATGYSLVQGVEVAVLLGKYAPHAPPGEEICALRKGLARRSRFMRFLNWMLFRAVHPGKRLNLMERFYGFSEGLIDRYYACRPGRFDPWMLLFWKPPHPRYFKILPEKGSHG